MWNTVFLTAALALGQPGDSLPDIAPVATPPLKALAAPQFSKAAAEQPAAPAPADAPAILSAPDQPAPAADQTPAPVNITAPLLPIPTPAAPAAAAAPYKPPVWPVTHPWKLMQSLQGTYEGALMDSQRIDIYGWAEASANASSAAINNLPMGWDDRSNRVELEQFFVRLERQVVTTGTTMPTWGFRSDWLIGTDYRYTLPRGIFNSQLINSKPSAFEGSEQNLYGVDPVEFYAEVYIPTVLNGLDIKAGRWYAPYGEESIEAVSTPLVSRSYTFNNGPEFTNFGVLATLNLGGFGTSSSTPGPTVWTLCGGYAIGNDIVQDAGAAGRFVGYVKWTQPGSLATPVYGRNTVTLATTIGAGKFNSDAPFATESTLTPTFGGISGEWGGGSVDTGNAGGRNNINVVDLLYTHTFNPVLSYAAEGLFGWQYDLPTTPTPNGGTGQVVRGGGTAYWGSLSQYVFYTLSSRLTATGRVELFEDAQGQRTGFAGLYTEVTAGLAWKPRYAETTPYLNGGGLIIRPELRWDENGQSRAFNAVYPGGASHNLYTAAMDVIVRW